jgi:DNA-binding transcriptional MerR regulator
MEPQDTDRQYTAEEVASLANVPRRTLRYYIQLGLVDPPEGETRAAYYTWKHLGRMLEIRRLTEQGVSLERVREQLKHGPQMRSPAVAAAPGSIAVKSHITLADGIELVIEPGRAGLTPENLRRFAREALAAYRRLSESKE